MFPILLSHKSWLPWQSWVCWYVV